MQMECSMQFISNSDDGEICLKSTNMTKFIEIGR